MNPAFPQAGAFLAGGSFDLPLRFSNSINPARKRVAADLEVFGQIKPLKLLHCSEFSLYVATRCRWTDILVGFGGLSGRYKKMSWLKQKLLCGGKSQRAIKIGRSRSCKIELSLLLLED